MPPTMGAAMRCMTSAPVPSDHMMGARPAMITATVIASRPAIEAWMKAVFACNAYVDGQAPWALRKTNPERMRRVLATLAPFADVLISTLSD